MLAMGVLAMVVKGPPDRPARAGPAAFLGAFESC